MMCDLSCYILTYNRCDYLKKQLESVLKQTYRDYKLYILDNASTDETEMVVKSYVDERLVYIRHKKNIGVFQNVMFAFEHCTTEYLIILHDDDMCNEELFQKEIDVLNGNRNVAICSSNALIIDETDRVKGLLKRGMDENVKYAGNRYLRDYITDGNVMVFPSVMYRSDFMRSHSIRIDEKVGPCSDVVFCADIYREGGEGVELSEPLMYYRHHELQGSVTERSLMQTRLYNYLRNSVRFSVLLNEMEIDRRKALNKHVKSWMIDVSNNMISYNDGKNLVRSFAQLIKADSFDVRMSLVKIGLSSVFRIPIRMLSSVILSIRDKGGVKS